MVSVRSEKLRLEAAGDRAKPEWGADGHCSAHPPNKVRCRAERDEAVCNQSAGSRVVSGRLRLPLQQTKEVARGEEPPCSSVLTRVSLLKLRSWMRLWKGTSE